MRRLGPNRLGRFPLGCRQLCPALAATAYNLTRAADHLASTFHARARTDTIRRHLINIPARIATGARRFTLHLPQLWRCADDFTDLWTATGQRMVT